MNLPPDIKEIFFKTLYGDLPVPNFEQWLYQDKRLESLLTPRQYLDLISYGYKGDGVKDGLDKILEGIVDKAEYEKWRLLHLLHKALKRDDQLPQILMTFYDLYCKGYNFLDNLGLGYGLAVQVPIKLAYSWDKLTQKQQQTLLNSFFPQIEEEIKKVIHWLEKGKVVVTGVKIDYNHFENIDNRTAEERKPTAYNIARAVSLTPHQNNIQKSKPLKPKPWWKIW